MSEIATPRRILRKAAVKNIAGITADSTLYAWMAEARFPKPIKIGARAVGWVESEIEDWLNARVAERDEACGGVA